MRLHIVIIRWNLNAQTVELYRPDLTIPEPAEVSVNREFTHLNQRRHPGAAPRTQDEAFSNGAKTRTEAQRERFQVGIHIETLFEGVNEPVSQDVGRKRNPGGRDDSQRNEGSCGYERGDQNASALRHGPLRSTMCAASRTYVSSLKLLSSSRPTATTPIERSRPVRGPCCAKRRSAPAVPSKRWRCLHRGREAAYG